MDVDQVIKLGYKETSDKFGFQFDNHGLGEVVTKEDLTLSGSGPLELDTGLVFFLYSADASVEPNGYYYQVLPTANGTLKSMTGTTPVACPIMHLVCKNSYNLQYKKDKEGLKLLVFPSPHVASGSTVIAKDSVVCRLIFTVGYDLIKKVSCVKLS